LTKKGAPTTNFVLKNVFWGQILIEPTHNVCSFTLIVFCGTAKRNKPGMCHVTSLKNERTGMIHFQFILRVITLIQVDSKLSRPLKLQL
jgi:hypothetical protein